MPSVRSRSSSVRNTRTDRVKLASYLGVQQSARFSVRERTAGSEVIRWRIRVVFIAVVVLAFGLWGILREIV